MVKSQTIGVAFTKVFDEYRNKVENQLAGVLKKKWHCSNAKD